MDSIFQGNIAGLSKWEPLSHAGIYLGNSPFHAGLVALVLNPATCLVSPQFHVVFDDEFSAAPFLRESTISQSRTNLVQNSSHSGAPENIDIKGNWFTSDLGGYFSETPSHESSVAPENNNIYFHAIAIQTAHIINSGQQGSL